MKYRKKPVVIEAWKVAVLLEDATNSWALLPEYVVKAYDAGNVVFGRDIISVKTLEGDMIAEKGDWIIRGVKGELYPCKPDIFEATYDEVFDA